MGGPFQETTSNQPPITDEPAEAAGADAGYIEFEIRRIEDSFEGEERIARLLDFIALTIAEVCLTQDFKPGIIRNEDDDKVRLLRGLTPGILPINRENIP